MEILWPFQYWTLSISKRHIVTLHHVINIQNDMLDRMDGILRPWDTKKTEWKDDLYFAVKFTRQKLPKYYVEVSPTTGMLHISAHVLDVFRKLRSFRKWETGMDINYNDETSYTTQYQEAFLNYVENEYCAKYTWLSVTQHEKLQSNGFISTAMVSQSGQSTCDPYDLSSDVEEYLTPKNVAETAPRRSDRAAAWVKPARHYLNSLSESPKNCRQVNLNLDDYHSDPVAISSTFWILDITEWWHRQEEMHSKYAHLSNLPPDIFSIIPHGVWVKASFSLGWVIVGCRKSKITCETLREMVVVRQYAPATNGTSAGDDRGLDRIETNNNLELNTEPAERKLHRMAKVHDLLEMWQDSQIYVPHRRNHMLKTIKWQP